MDKLNQNDVAKPETEEVTLEHKEKTLLEKFEEQKNRLSMSNSPENEEFKLQQAENKEKMRQQELTGLRKKLGISKSESETNESREDLDSLKETQKEVTLEKKANEDISNSIKSLSQSVEELYKSLRRNNFQRINFNSEKLLNVTQKEDLDHENLSREIQDLTSFINRITPPDPRDRLLEPRNFRAVIEEMENVYTRLSKLRGVFENSSTIVSSNLSKEISRTQNSLSKRKDDLIRSLSSLQRYLGR